MWSLIFLMSFTCSSRKWLSRKSRSWESARAEPRARRSKRAWFRFFSRTMAASIASWVLPHSSWDGFCSPGRGHGCCAGFASSRDAQSIPASPRAVRGQSGPRFQSRIVAFEIEAQREVGSGGRRCTQTR